MVHKILLTKAQPAPSTNGAGKYWNLQGCRSDKAATCNDCQNADLFWSWNFLTGRSYLVDHLNYPHTCPSPQTQDVFPGWCEKCQAPDLLWLRKQEAFELTESYGLPHACEQHEYRKIREMSAGHCKYCNTSNLLWVTVDRATLCHLDGKKHICTEYMPFMKDWAEAKRINYAFEKSWLKSIPDGTICKKCKGQKYISYLSKNKRILKKYNSPALRAFGSMFEPILMHRPCKHCKCMGAYTVQSKKSYLKNLRMKYWPFKSGFHKWKKDGK